MEEQAIYDTINKMAYDSLMQRIENMNNVAYPITASMVIDSLDFTDNEKWAFLYAQASNKREDYEMFLRKRFSDIDHAKITFSLLRKLTKHSLSHMIPINPPFKGVALSTQEGGNHYKDFPIQPIEFITKNGLSFAQGNVIKYICRYKAKNGLQDLKKARHYIDLMIELEYGDQTEEAQP